MRFVVQGMGGLVLKRGFSKVAIGGQDRTVRWERLREMEWVQVLTTQLLKEQVDVSLTSHHGVLLFDLCKGARRSREVGVYCGGRLVGPGC